MMSFTLSRYALATGALLASSCFTFAENLVPAEQLLQQWQQITSAEASNPDETVGLKESLASMSREEAADAWLKTAIAILDEDDYYRRDDHKEQVEELFNALPSKEDWPLLEERLKKIPDHDKKGLSGTELAYFLAFLNGDIDTQWKIFKASEPAAKAQKRGSLFGAFFSSRASASPTSFQDKHSRLADWLLSVSDTRYKTKENLLLQLSLSSYIEINRNWLELFSEEEIKNLLLKNLTTDSNYISLQNDEEVLKTIRRLYLEILPQLTKPAWYFIAELNDIEIFEASLARFNRLSRRDAEGEYRHVVYPYLKIYIKEGEFDKAKSLLLLSPKELEMSRLGWDTSLPKDQQALSAHFFEDILEKNPDLMVYHLYAEASRLSDRTDDAIAFLQKLDQRVKGIEQKEELKREILELQLSKGNTDVYLSLLDAKNSDFSEYTSTIHNALIIGTFHNKPELKARAIEAIQELEISRNEIYSLNNLIHSLQIVGENGAAQDLLIRITDEWLSQLIKSKSSSKLYMQSIDVALGKLIHLYVQEGMMDDALAILQDSGLWSADDLSQVLDRLDLETVSSFIPLLDYAGESAAAQKIAITYISKHPSRDAFYQGFLKVGEPSLVKDTLKEMASQYPFEERPTLWLAEALRQQGRLDEAEETARKAIAIDPSDGNSPRGDRMRAYEVLAKILVAKGETEDAAFYQNIVAAIRMAEDADLLFSAGLIEEALKMYEESLTLFADAYCIQSRMAIQLHSMGRIKEAEAHYRKAYELMPSSFGRMESHCFGCEGAFRGDQAQAIALEVFTSMVEEQPEQAQPYYLLGYLYQSKGEDEKAIEYFKQAVEIDPLYISAWKSLINSYEDTLFTGSAKQEIMEGIAKHIGQYKHKFIDADWVSQPAAFVDLNIPAFEKKDIEGNLYPLNQNRLAAFLPEEALSSNKPYDRGYSPRTITDFESLLLMHPVTRSIFKYR